MGPAEEDQRHEIPALGTAPAVSSRLSRLRDIANTINSDGGMSLILAFVLVGVCNGEP